MIQPSFKFADTALAQERLNLLLADLNRYAEADQIDWLDSDIAYHAALLDSEPVVLAVWFGSDPAHVIGMHVCKGELVPFFTGRDLPVPAYKAVFVRDESQAQELRNALIARHRKATLRLV